MKKILIVQLAFIVVCVLSGCSKKTLESAITRVDSIHITDTIIIHARPDTVFVEVPASSQSVVTPDTTSHLEDDLYESDASWDGQFLHHSLNSKRDAKLKAPVIIHDTVRIKEKVENHSKDEKKKETIYVQPTWKEKFAYSGVGFLVCALIWLIYACRKKIKRVFELIGL